MAERKPLFLSSEGFSEEMAQSDTATFGGLTLSGDIAMGSNKVTGLAAASSSGDAISYGQSSASLAGLTLTGDLALGGTNKVTGLADGTASTDAVNKGQLDQAVINGGSFKEALLHPDQVDDTEGILASSALTMTSNPVSGDTITITDGTTTRTYGAASGGDVQYSIGAGVADTMQNLATAIAGDGSAAWGATFTTDLDAIDSDGVVVITEDDNDGTASKIYGTWGTQASCQVVDFTGELDYTKKTTANLPSSEPGSTNFGIRRTQASLTDGELHYVLENDTVYGWDDSGNTWQVMSGTAGIPDATSASGGGTKGKLTADEDYGLEISSGILIIDLSATPGLEFSSGDLQVKANTNAGIEVTASGVGVDLAASNPGLQFDGSGDLQVLANTSAGLDVGASGVEIDLAASNPGLEFSSGDLQVQVVSTGGIERAATGIQVKIDDTPDTLDSDADGLKVVGLPSLFKVNGTAVGATVTAANLDDLTDGSNADSLHTHASATATEAPKVENTEAVDESVAIADPVYYTATGDRVGKATANTDAKARVVGVARTAQSTVGQTCEVVNHGPAAGTLSGATPGTAYYLQATGGIGTSLPGAGNRVIQVGIAKSATVLFVRIVDYGKKAA